MCVILFPVERGVDSTLSAECSFTVIKAVKPTFYDYKATVLHLTNDSTVVINVRQWSY